jgi:membrane protein implicated in regulation of membrane protease activity
MSTLAQHGAAIASPSIAGAAISSNGDGWVTLAQAALSLAIVLALAILWWRTLRPRAAPGRGRGQL